MGAIKFKVSVYLNESDAWHHLPLHLEILKMLYEQGIAGGTVLRAVAGFTGAAGLVTTSLVDVGSKLPLKVEFIDSAEKVESVLPRLLEMAGHRLITKEQVEILNTV